MRKNLKQLYDKKSNWTITQEIEHVKSDKNFHVMMTMNTRENVRRTKSLSRFKNAICMDNGYREIFKHDRFYVYHLTPHFFFASNQCNSFPFLPD